MYTVYAIGDALGRVLSVFVGRVSGRWIVPASLLRIAIFTPTMYVFFWGSIVYTIEDHSLIREGGILSYFKFHDDIAFCGAEHAGLIARLIFR